MALLPIAALSVWSTLTAPRSWLAYPENARILVLDCVASMPTAGSGTTCLFVSATRVIKEIPSADATGSQVSIGKLEQREHVSNIFFNQPPLGGQRSLILATRLLVAPTLCAMKETRRRLVRVCQVFKETLTLSASQSARSTKSVRPTWLASDKSVRILVLEFAAHTPHALSTTTTPSANVTLAMREIPSQIATEKQHVSNCMNFLSFNLNLPVPPRVEPIDPCNPSPCGSNAVCNRQRNAGSCQCIPEYFGDPYVACRPECVVHSDCPSNKACQRNKCIDPCPGTCGINAQCQVRSHSPTCTCIPNYIGDPFTACRLKPLRE